MRIAIGQAAHETNTFSNVATSREMFEAWNWDSGMEILRKSAGVRDYLGGMIDGAEALGVEVVPTFSAFAYPAGRITHETYAELKERLVDAIAMAGQVDAICLALHGAGVAEEVDDIEADLLYAVRGLVGEFVPVVASLDLHANVTEPMVELADALLGNHLYPHTDSYDRGAEAVQVARKMALGELRPRMHLQTLPLLLPTSTTNLHPAKTVNETCWGWEERTGVLDCAFFHGFPYADVPGAGASVLATSNGDGELTRQAAEEVGNHIWSLREQFFPELPTPTEGIAAALKSQDNPIILNETSDNPGGGTPGDGTHLLRALVESDHDGCCFASVFDPEVAEEAHRMGTGAVIDVSLGGKTDNLHGEPLRARAYVKTLTDGRFIQSSPMWRGRQVEMGLSARLEIGNVDVVVCSEKAQVLDEQIFLLHGIDVSEYKIVALKSSQHFRAAFEPIVSEILAVDSPGLSTFRFTNFDFKRLERPVYPLDDGLCAENLGS